ncbi:MAG: hypothetical protein AB7O59_10705 [Pirellulales bacterium]
MALQVGGELQLVIDGQAKNLPMSVIANLKFDEQLLALDSAGLPASTVRYYDDTRAVIKVEKGGEKPSLDDEHRLIVAERPTEGPSLLSCPTSPLRREELDLIDVPGSSLMIDQLLPATPVALGETWKWTDQMAANLLCLDAVRWTDVTSALGEVKDGLVEIAAAGSVSGAVGGVSTEIELKAKYRYDLARQRVVFLALLVKEKRAVGHIGPGLDTVAKLIMTITPLTSSQLLTPQRVAAATTAPAATAAELGYRAVSGQFQFHYDRRWFLTSDDAKLTVMRLLDRGELVAQCNISLLPGDKTAPVSLAEFQRDVQTSLGKNFGQFTGALETTNETGYRVLRVVARGVVSEVPIEWIYYLVQDTTGRRVTLSFTYQQELVERFAQADRSLVRQLRMTDSPAPTAARAVERK